MQLKITHETHYRYSAAVEIQPHLLRFCPRNDGAQTATSFELSITPEPVGRTDQLDLEGNLVRYVWFDGAHQEMTIRAATTVNTQRTNPFDFLKPHSGLSLPRLYESGEHALLHHYLTRDVVNHVDDEVGRFAAKISKRVAGDVIRFLTELNQEICDRVKLEHRASGEPFPPDETLNRGSGACRDAAVLFMDACRAVGIAARFASGYHLNDDPKEANELHGWVEAYIPNAGWRGFDPSVGVLVADEHVTVAAASSPRDTAPVTGAYCGQAITRMESRVTVQQLRPSNRRSANRPHVSPARSSLV